jgi:hypothetical protein
MLELTTKGVFGRSAHFRFTIPPQISDLSRAEVRICGVFVSPCQSAQAQFCSVFVSPYQLSLAQDLNSYTKAPN